MTLSYLRTTIGKKVVVALSGLAISLFTVMHMASNLLILVSAESYNKYSHALVTNPFIYVAEIGLALTFLVHMGLALSLAIENRAKRPQGYAVSPVNKGASFASRTMVLSGLVLLVFLVLHLITFKFGAYYSVTYAGVEMRDLHKLVVEKFHEPAYVAGYLFALLVLGLHLSHGIAGAFQSLGVTSSLNPKLKLAGWVFAVVIAGGFISQPIVTYFFLER